MTDREEMRRRLLARRERDGDGEDEGFRACGWWTISVNGVEHKMPYVIAHPKPGAETLYRIVTVNGRAQTTGYIVADEPSDNAEGAWCLVLEEEAEAGGSVSIRNASGAGVTVADGKVTIHGKMKPGDTVAHDEKVTQEAFLAEMRGMVEKLQRACDAAKRRVEE